MASKESDYVLRTIRFPRELYRAIEKRKADLGAAFRPSSVTALVIQACAAAYAENGKEVCNG